MTTMYVTPNQKKAQMKRIARQKHIQQNEIAKKVAYEYCLACGREIAFMVPFPGMPMPQLCAGCIASADEN